MTTPITAEAAERAAYWKEIIAGADEDLAGATAVRRDAEYTLRRCIVQENEMLAKVMDLRQRHEAVSQ